MVQHTPRDYPVRRNASFHFMYTNQTLWCKKDRSAHRLLSFHSNWSRVLISNNSILQANVSLDFLPSSFSAVILSANSSQLMWTITWKIWKIKNNPNVEQFMTASLGGFLPPSLRFDFLLMSVFIPLCGLRLLQLAVFLRIHLPVPRLLYCFTRRSDHCWDHQL